jgi:CheY-like chemotaxis protein
MYKNLKIIKNYRPFIVCVSAYEDHLHEEKAKKAGMKGFLTKPVPQ